MGPEPGEGHRIDLGISFRTTARSIALLYASAHRGVLNAEKEEDLMDLITVLILAAIPFVIVPIIIFGDDQLFERRPNRRA